MAPFQDVRYPERGMETTLLKKTMFTHLSCTLNHPKLRVGGVCRPTPLFSACMEQISMLTVTVNNKKALIRCRVPARSLSRSKCCGTVVRACRPVCVRWHPKVHSFLPTGWVIDHKRRWLAEPRRDAAGQRCLRDIDWVNGGFVTAGVQVWSRTLVQSEMCSDILKDAVNNKDQEWGVCSSQVPIFSLPSQIFYGLSFFKQLLDRTCRLRTSAKNERTVSCFPVSFAP